MTSRQSVTRRGHGDPPEYILTETRKRARQDEPMPLMLHDWVAWTRASDLELTHVKKIVDTARGLGYTLVTHIGCLRNRALWA